MPLLFVDAFVTCKNLIFIVSDSASGLTRMLHVLAYTDLLNENVVSGMSLVRTRGLYESHLSAIGLETYSRIRKEMANYFLVK